MQLAQGPAVWVGSDQQARDWIVTLDEEDCAELTRAAELLRGRPLGQVRPGDFRISRMAPKLAAMAAALESGTGFVMLRGLPAASLEQDLLENV